MILLHFGVAALYGFVAWSLWPASHDSAANARAFGPAKRPPAAWAAWLLPVALLLHGWVVVRDIVRQDGLDLSLENALSVVAGLVAALAWLSGLLRTMPVIGTVVLPVAAVALLLPLAAAKPHRFQYAVESWAAAHVAVALIAYSLFIVAAVHALVLMGLEKRLHARRPDPDADSLPSLLTLERLLFRLVSVGFLLLTLAIGSGILFSEQMFGRPLTFTHKSLFSVLAWLTFGALLWGRWKYGWRGRAALRWILTGTVFLLLAYLGTKFVLEVILGR